MLFVWNLFFVIWNFAADAVHPSEMVHGVDGHSCPSFIVVGTLRVPATFVAIDGIHSLALRACKLGNNSERQLGSIPLATRP